MKFAIVTVILALTLGVQSDYLHAPLVAPLPLLTPHSAYSTFTSYPYNLRSPLRFNYVPAHHIVAAPYYAPLFTGQATYVAKTLGSEHIAPLPGHTDSTASINLEPAPRTD